MIYIAAFIVGVIAGGLVVFGLVTVCLACARSERAERRALRRMGYVDLTHANTKGGTASARPYDAENSHSGGHSSQPPTHLQVVKGEKHGR